jgi:hypothetical protein
MVREMTVDICVARAFLSGSGNVDFGRSKAGLPEIAREFLGRRIKYPVGHKGPKSPSERANKINLSS